LKIIEYPMFPNGRTTNKKTPITTPIELLADNTKTKIADTDNRAIVPPKTLKIFVAFFIKPLSLGLFSNNVPKLRRNAAQRNCVLCPLRNAVFGGHEQLWLVKPL
jgi:hypothetical protein